MIKKMLFDRVLVKPKEEKETEGGLQIIESTSEKPLTGTVISKGETADKIEVNDQIMFGQFAGVNLTIDGVEHKIIKQEEIFAIL